MGMFDDLVPASAGPAKRGGGLFADLIAPKYDPTEGMSTSEKFLAGVGKAMTDAGRGVGQMVGLVSQDEIDEAKALEEKYASQGSASVEDELEKMKKDMGL